MACDIPLDEIKQAVLDELSKHGILATALAAGGVKRHEYRVWLQTDNAFVEAVDDAMANSADVIENEVFRRAIIGVDTKKVVGKGDNAEVITVTTYSDSLAAMMLKGAKPEKYAERSKNELSGPGGKPVDINDTTAAARIVALLDAARIRKSDDIDPLS